MKVCIGSEFTTNPYGGGNLFIKNLTEYLLKMNHSVVYDLKDIDIDIILMINPLKNSEKSTLNNYDIDFTYLDNNIEILSKDNDETLKKLNTTIKKKNKKDVKELWKIFDNECIIDNKSIECLYTNNKDKDILIINVF